MSCFKKVLVITAALFGLGMVGTDVTTVTWESPPAVAAGAVLDAVTTPPVAALDVVRTLGGLLSGLESFGDLECDLCEEEEKTCHEIFWSQYPTLTDQFEAYCGEMGGSHVVLAHRFHLATGCVGGGDPDLTGLGTGALGECEECECAACGGESTCHSYWDPGPCHVECAGGDPEFALALEEAVHLGNIAQGIQLVTTRQHALRLVQTSDLLQIVSSCSVSGVLAQFAIDSPFASALRESGALALDD
jgi:hypothetical protein